MPRGPKRLVWASFFTHDDTRGMHPVSKLLLLRAMVSTDGHGTVDVSHLAVWCEQEGAILAPEDVLSDWKSCGFVQVFEFGHNVVVLQFPGFEDSQPGLEKKKRGGQSTLDRVIESLGPPITSKSTDRLDELVGDQVGESVDDKVGDQVDDPLADEVVDLKVESRKGKVERGSDSESAELREDAPSTPAPAGDPPEPALIEFRTSGKPATWSLTASQVERWREDFPAVDVAAECRRARAWIEANPTKRKTARGMPRFLVSWLGRAQDRGGSVKTSSAQPRAAPTTFSEAKAANIRRNTQEVLAEDFGVTPNDPPPSMEVSNG